MQIDCPGNLAVLKLPLFVTDPDERQATCAAELLMSQLNSLAKKQAQLTRILPIAWAHPGLEPPMVTKLFPDLCVHLPLIFYHSKFERFCAPIPSLLISPNQLRQPTASMAYCPLPD